MLGRTKGRLWRQIVEWQVECCRELPGALEFFRNPGIRKRHIHLPFERTWTTSFNSVSRTSGKTLALGISSLSTYVKTKILCFLICFFFFFFSHLPVTFYVLWKFHWVGNGQVSRSVKCQNLPILTSLAPWLLTNILCSASGIDNKKKMCRSLKHRFAAAWGVHKLHACVLLSTKKVFFQMKWWPMSKRGNNLMGDSGYQSAKGCHPQWPCSQNCTPTNSEQ